MTSNINDLLTFKVVNIISNYTTHFTGTLGACIEQAAKWNKEYLNYKYIVEPICRAFPDRIMH
jgi:hypothetical protein